MHIPRFPPLRLVVIVRPLRARCQDLPLPNPLNDHQLLPTITVSPYEPNSRSSMSASTTRQRKTGGLSTTDSDGVDHAQAGPQGKKVKQTPVSQCASP